MLMVTRAPRTVDAKPVIQPFCARATGHLRVNVCQSNLLRTQQHQRQVRLNAAASISTIATDAVEVAELSASQPSKPFSWTARWWPIHDVASLDPKVPMHVDLLGMSLVVWADTKGSWHCLEDRCPHRLAPLSEGRVEPQGLMCCYHGWTFDGNGSCTSIPQMAPDAEAAACSSKRACVKSYPTMVAHGLLWVWPEAGQTEAANQAADSVKSLIITDGFPGWFIRDLPVRYDHLMDNVIDPSHVPFSHHSVQFYNRYSARARSMWSGMSTTEVTDAGFVASSDVGMFGSTNLDFVAPYMARYGSHGITALQVLVVPTKPGWSRVMTNTRTILPNAPWLFNAYRKLRNNFTGMVHAGVQNAIFDGDTYMLHVAERKLLPSKGLGINTVAREYYMPAKTDASLIGFRRWIQEFAGPIPTCRPEDEPFMPPLMPQEQALDRYNQHVKHCKECKKTVKMLEAGMAISKTLGVAAAVAAGSIMVAAVAVLQLQPSTQGNALPTAAATLSTIWQGLQATGLLTMFTQSIVATVCAWAVFNLFESLRKKFFFQEYIHALKD